MGSIKVTQLEKANTVMSDLYINWDLPNKKVSHTLIYGCDILSADELYFTWEFLSVDSKVLNGSTLQPACWTPGPVSLSITAKTWTWLSGKSGSSTLFLKIQHATQLQTIDQVSVLHHVLTAEPLMEFTILLSYSGVTLQQTHMVQLISHTLK